jgi:hypothetical protein
LGFLPGLASGLTKLGGVGFSGVISADRRGDFVGGAAAGTVFFPGRATLSTGGKLVLGVVMGMASCSGVAKYARTASMYSRTDSLTDAREILIDTENERA